MVLKTIIRLMRNTVLLIIALIFGLYVSTLLQAALWDRYPLEQAAETLHSIGL